MWIARNRDGELRVFEMPPRRFHSGPTLPYEKTGFNDVVYIDEGKEDTYSFWAIQEFYNSNTIKDRKAYGLKLCMSKDKDVWGTYEPEWTKTITWEDEPVEVKIINYYEFSDKISETFCEFFPEVGKIFTKGATQSDDDFYNRYCKFVDKILDYVGGKR